MSLPFQTQWSFNNGATLWVTSIFKHDVLMLGCCTLDKSALSPFLSRLVNMELHRTVDTAAAFSGAQCTRTACPHHDKRTQFPPWAVYHQPRGSVKKLKCSAMIGEMLWCPVSFTALTQHRMTHWLPRKSPWATVNWHSGNSTPR